MIYRNPGFYFVESDPSVDMVTIVSSFGFLWEIRDILLNSGRYYGFAFQPDVLFDEKGVPHLICYANYHNSELEEYEIMFFGLNSPYINVREELINILGYRMTVRHRYVHNIKEAITKLIYGIRGEEMG